jgi:hypothetical protein
LAISPPAVVDAIHFLYQNDMLRETGKGYPGFEATAKLHAWVEQGLLCVPFPKQIWVIPEAE